MKLFGGGSRFSGFGLGMKLRSELKALDAGTKEQKP